MKNLAALILFFHQYSISAKAREGGPAGEEVIVESARPFKHLGSEPVFPRDLRRCGLVREHDRGFAGERHRDAAVARGRD